MESKHVVLLQRNPEIIWRVEKRREQQLLETLDAGGEADESGTVTLIQAGMMHQLNLLGGMIWKLCDGTRDLEAIVDALAAEFAVDRAELRADVAAFVDDLVARGWLRHEG